MTRGIAARRWTVTCSALVGVLALACGGELPVGTDTAVAAEPGMSASVSTPPATAAPLCPDPNAGRPTLNDAQILGVLKVANQGEIDQGRLAVTLGNTPEVRAFGQEMVTEHSAANAQLDALSQKLGFGPAPSPLSNQLQAEAKQIATILGMQTGMSFDRGYTDSQVQMHAQLNFIIDMVLVPQVRNPDLKAGVVAARRMSQEHLEKAEPLQSRLSPAP